MPFLFQQLAKEDMQILEHFMNKDAAPQRKLADLFRDKITEKQTEIQSQVDASSEWWTFYGKLDRPREEQQKTSKHAAHIKEDRVKYQETVTN